MPFYIYKEYRFGVATTNVATMQCQLDDALNLQTDVVSILFHKQTHKKLKRNKFSKNEKSSKNSDVTKCLAGATAFSFFISCHRSSF